MEAGKPFQFYLFITTSLVLVALGASHLEGQQLGSQQKREPWRQEEFRPTSESLNEGILQELISASRGLAAEISQTYRPASQTNLNEAKKLPPSSGRGLVIEALDSYGRSAAELRQEFERQALAEQKMTNGAAPAKQAKKLVIEPLSSD